MKYALVAAAALLVAGPAFAQSQSNRTSSAPPNSSATVGAMTEAQAKSQIEGAGYSGVSGLKKNADGSWSGKASKAGSSHTVMLGADGRVVEE